MPFIWPLFSDPTQSPWDNRQRLRMNDLDDRMEAFWPDRKRSVRDTPAGSSGETRTERRRSKDRR